MKTKPKLQFKEMPADYAGLCALLLPRPIHDDVDYANVTEVADAVALWQDEFTADQADYFDLLCSIIEEYDRKQVEWPQLAPLDRLRHLLDQRGLSAADLSRILGGSRNLGAMILRGERNLTVAHIRELAAHFNVSPEMFL